jgi:hypothetical protein
MRAGFLALGFAVLTLAGCGPIVYINDVTRGASTKVDEAREAGADKYSLYWWTRATEYLRKSRELAAHADFQAANRYGRLAGEAAEKAIEEALIASKDPAKRNAPAKEPDKGPVAPAKETP